MMRRTALALTTSLGLSLLAGCGLLHPHESTRFVVFFTDFSAQLDGPARETIAQASKSAGDHPFASVTVSGFAAADSSSANQALSLARAHVVSDALRDAGVDPQRIRPRGKGPVEYALDPVQARRVEITIGG